MLKKSHINLALKKAKESANKNEIPVGCVIFDNKGKVISSASNSSIEK